MQANSAKNSKNREIGARIRLLREHERMNGKAFAATLGIQPVTLSRYENGRAVPSDVLVLLLRLEPELDANWLLTGEGQMFRDRDVVPPVELQETLEKEQEARMLIQNHAVRLGKELTAAENRIKELEAQLAQQEETNQEAG
jgi:transcriptional regulator with XRE-family HTH domain